MKLIIKQYRPHETIAGYNVLDRENSLPRTEAIDKIAHAVEGIKNPRVIAEVAIETLLGEIIYKGD